MSDGLFFSMTREGYAAAKKYLMEIGRYDEYEEYNKFLNNNTSVDGYSLVAFANSIKENNDE